MKLLIAFSFVMSQAAAAVWLPPRMPAVRVAPEEAGVWKVTSTAESEYTLESVEQFPAKPGDSFAVNLRIRVGLSTRALPELACYDAAGREIPARSSLAAGPDIYTTDWQPLQRVFPALPGTASVRARLRGAGHGDVWISHLEFRPANIDPYRTGALISQLYPNRRRGLVLESDRYIVNRARMTEDDRDGDGKWALVTVDLDAISQPERSGEDWRTRFEYRPNEIYWSDGAVLKSDSVREDATPDFARALHFRTTVQPGAYHAFLNDPGRALAVSTDGRTWKRYEGGTEAELGTLEARGGILEVWADACYRDPVSTGPAYFDYLRLFPADDPASIGRLFSSARQAPAKLTRGSVAEKVVPVTVEAPPFPHGLSRPARCGLPILRGELASAAHAAVYGPDGQRVPSQCRTMAVWPDGSVKWLYCDFPAPSDGQYAVHYGHRVRPLAPAARLRVERTPRGLEVDTGAIRFRVPNGRFGMLEDVRLASGEVLQRGPLAVEITETGGQVWRALDVPVDKLEIEQAGPFQAVIRGETRFPEWGRPAEGFGHVARIRACAGSPLVEIEYFVANTDSRAPVRQGWLGSKLDVRSIAVKLAPASPVKSAMHGEGRGAGSGAAAQKDAGTIVVDGRESRGRLPGWAAFGLGDGAIALGVENFHEQFPKAFRWSPGEIEISLWAREGGVYEWNEGVGKTHRLSLYFAKTVPPDAAALAGGPVLALARPEDYIGSGAFGDLTTAAASGNAGVEATLAAAMKGVVEKVGLGFENYGDHSSPGYVKGTVAWANNEYDQPAAALYHFFRTGNREALRLGLASARHFLDVDIGHFSARNAKWRGAARVHGHGIIGHHTAEAPNMHHAGDIQGLILYSYLTGDPTGITGAEGVARWVLRSSNPAASVGSMERALGHPLLALVDVYEATWDPEYLRGAARLVDWALKWEHPDRGGFLAPVTESPAFYSGSPFCGGLLPTALIKFNSWARLPEIDRMLERTARWTLTDMWRPPANIIHKGGPPRAAANANPRHISSHLRLMADVYARTRDPLYLVAPALSVEAAFGEGVPPFGFRNSGLVFNYLPWFLRTVSDSGRPALDAALKISAPPVVDVRKGSQAPVCFTLANEGPSAVEKLAVSFHARLDLAAEPPAPLRRIPSGEIARVCTAVSAPAWLNLTSEANRIAYGHLSATFERDGQARMAHAFIKITAGR